MDKILVKILFLLIFLFTFIFFFTWHGKEWRNGTGIKVRRIKVRWAWSVENRKRIRGRWYKTEWRNIRENN